MRVAAISDIHGNLPALEAVMAEVERERPDLVVFCGDVASGPMPSETIDYLMALKDAQFVRGNADRGLVEEFDEKPSGQSPGPFADWCAKQITRGHRDFLKSFEDKVVLDHVDGLGRVVFCHASPRNDSDVMTVKSAPDRFRLLLAGVDAQVVVCGHTHMQFDRTVDGIRVVNAGSVGMPYGLPGAYWAILGPDIDLRRTDYDREAAVIRIRAKDWEYAEEFAIGNVLNCPSVEQGLDFMSRAEARQAATA